MSFSIGVDVGSRSARALALDLRGSILGSQTEPITVFNPQPNYFEHSSADIWAAVCTCIQRLGRDLDLSRCVGLGFDATCSLVLLDQDGLGHSLPLRESGEADTIMWMDHRAAEDAAAINATSHERLRYVGGAISLESQPPKLRWLKRNMDGAWWERIGGAFDLPDFLTFKATGAVTRSQCSLVCKWLYSASEESRGWDDSFWKAIGLECLTENNFAKIGNVVKAPGEKIGELCKEAAAATGLPQGVAVAASIIDAHAGVLGALASVSLHESFIASTLVIIAGTSACHMALGRAAAFVPGVWGPYFEVLGLPGIWLNEGGQSAVGSVLDMLIGVYGTGLFAKDASLTDCHRQIIAELQELPPDLAASVHVWPDYHGNRSPIASEKLRGAVIGLDLLDLNGGDSDDVRRRNMLKLYAAHVEAVALQSRQIVAALRDGGCEIHHVVVCGGLTQNPIFVQATADALGLAVSVPSVRETVALGSAVLGAAAGVNSSVGEIMAALEFPALSYAPARRDYFRQKARVFGRLQSLVETVACENV